VAVYQNNLEHLGDEFRRLDLLLEQAVADFRARRNTADHLAEFRGLFISDAEVDEVLAARGEASGESHAAAHERLASLRREIDERVTESRRAGLTLRLPYISAVFGLGPFETDLLVLALAPEFDLRYQKLYAYLQDDVSRRRPSVDLALRLLCRTASERARARDLFAEDSALMAHGLVALHEEAAERPAPLLNRSLKVDDRMVEFLRGSDRLDQRLTGAMARRVRPEQEACALLLSETLQSSLARLVRLTAEDAAWCCLLHGPAGSGKKSFAAAVCHETSHTLLLVNLSALLKSAAPFAALLRAAFREALLYGSAIYLDGWHELLHDEPSLRAARQLAEQEMAQFPGPIFLGSRAAHQPEGQPRQKYLSIELPRPAERIRAELWRAHLDNGTRLAADVDTAHLASAFRFTPGQIKQAVAQAKTEARLRQPDEHGLTMEDLLAACRMQSSRQLISFARKVTPRRGWGDLILPKDTLAQLSEFCQQVRYRLKVYDEWGFGARLSLGKGLLALFTGASGTGKTLSAEILARELGLDLYRVDLSSVVSKYIGETEKNLSRVFDDAQESNAILFFDEADALFGKRSEVKDAHDRYANIEISYLLQRVEEYEGAIILASNFSNNIDDAFLRRMHFNVEFPFPAEAHRLRIWRGIFPAQAPVAPDIDFEFLARKFKIAGGNIKNVALAAAFLAAQDGGVIRMPHLILALKREYQKLGKVCEKTEFESYYELVR
jgi:ATP-dependent 26S proteasome regulatory subunit